MHAEKETKKIEDFIDKACKFHVEVSNLYSASYIPAVEFDSSVWELHKNAITASSEGAFADGEAASAEEYVVYFQIHHAFDRFSDVCRLIEDMGESRRPINVPVEMEKYQSYLQKSVNEINYIAGRIEEGLHAPELAQQCRALSEPFIDLAENGFVQTFGDLATNIPQK